VRSAKVAFLGLPFWVAFAAIFSNVSVLSAIDFALRGDWGWYPNRRTAKG
jgi:hypothetical protein